MNKYKIGDTVKFIHNGILYGFKEGDLGVVISESNHYFRFKTQTDIYAEINKSCLNKFVEKLSHCKNTRQLELNLGDTQ